MGIPCEVWERVAELLVPREINRLSLVGGEVRVTRQRTNEIVRDWCRETVTEARLSRSKFVATAFIAIARTFVSLKKRFGREIVPEWGHGFVVPRFRQILASSAYQRARRPRSVVDQWIERWSCQRCGFVYQAYVEDQVCTCIWRGAQL